MKEDTEKERVEQLEQEEIEKQKRISRRSSSPAMRQSQPEVADRLALSEPIPQQSQFVSSLSLPPLSFRIIFKVFTSAINSVFLRN